MTRFLKRRMSVTHTGTRCIECAMYSRRPLGYSGTCLKLAIFRGVPMPEEWYCVDDQSHLINKSFILVPRPPDGTRCRDLDGNLKIVGVDV